MEVVLARVKVQLLRNLLSLIQIHVKTLFNKFSKIDKIVAICDDGTIWCWKSNIDTKFQELIN
uniref:Uncharacterized protein n=1 Tax=Rhizophagus irregularis (strain DAOM 181602 / DAOM 197198 / MUCL 43194) TaxID=747089 RepID=U9U667_RHIID